MTSLSANPESNSASLDTSTASETAPSVNTSATAPTAASQSESATADPEHTEYPEQKHAGKVGLGPNYKVHPTTSDKIEGQKDILIGKITGNEEKVQEGVDKKTGDKWEKEKAKDDAEDPFAKKEEA
ncbi:BQ2448_1371 [Microbotryum intermedium]|uniref:BQ2448_1371 protein n=1 Tax=Microbotryum intermedium TaxID=269621 RepID=A0A238F9Y3_9BASI|nr:BQ2448_1371 [Microbotryum intermedium]